MCTQRVLKPRSLLFLLLSGCIVFFVYHQYFTLTPGEKTNKIVSNTHLSKEDRSLKTERTTTEKATRKTPPPTTRRKKKKRKRKHRTTTKATPPRPPPPPSLRWEFLDKFLHDKRAFTQGLEFSNPTSNNAPARQTVYETTGLYGGRSSLRRVDLTTGKVLKSVGLGNRFFGEGMTIVNGKIYVLTWKSETGFIFDLKTFKKLDTFKFRTLRREGWGLTHDFHKKELIASDGSDYLFFWDMESLAETRRVRVQDDGGYVRKINELEYISVPVKGENGTHQKGIVLANIWYKDNIIAIDPETGFIVADYDFTKLLKDGDRYGGEDCLNGIAHNASSRITYLTGKLYGKMYKVKLDLEGLAQTLGKGQDDGAKDTVSTDESSSRDTNKEGSRVYLM